MISRKWDEEAFDKMMVKEDDQGAQVQSAQDDFQVYDGLGEIVLRCQWNIVHM